jgi:rsbT co-antagonist protein RsbR
MSEPIRVQVAGFEISWDLDKGLNLWAGTPTLSMWIPNTVAGLMLGMQRMVGAERFNLYMHSGGYDSVEGDWEVIRSQPTFAAGIAAMAPIAASAGWGHWEVVSVDEEKKEVVFRAYNNWEGLYQKQLGVCWGSGMMAGKFAGHASRYFGVTCWAEQTKFTATGDAYDEFVVRPSELTMEQRLQQLLASGKGTEMDLTTALQKLRQEVSERQKAENDLRDALAQVRIQEETLRKVSAPIIQVWDGVLTVPLMGFIDSDRAVLMMQRLLDEVVKTRARYTILDLTGVDVVDTNTADHLVRIIRAIELLGARAVITGIRSAVAQTMVSLGIDLSRITTLRNLQEGLKACMRGLQEDGAKAAAQTQAPARGASPRQADEPSDPGRDD